MFGQKITITEGPLLQNILRFSLPLMLSNILQVLFNLSDIAVVGRFAGAEALGSVGSCAILVSLFTGLLIGMGSGINAIAARFLGARDTNRLKKTVSASLMISLAYGLVILLAGQLSVKGILLLMQTKADLLDGAILYMTVYLLGVPALAVYNCGNGILSATGDSRRPLAYLAVSGAVNVALNLVFVICFRLGVLGVALASVISQYLSAFLILLRLVCCQEVYALSPQDVMQRPDRKIAQRVLLLGLSAGVQNAVFSLANLFIQSAVNSFDTVMVEGNSAAANADALIYDMMAAFYVACTVFMAQNYGAGKKKRIMQSYRICLALSFSVAAVFGGLMLLFGRQFLGIFTTEEAVVSAGMKRLGIMAWSYCVSAFMDCTIAAARGFGRTVAPTVIVVLGSCAFRIVWIYTVFAYFHTIPSLYLLYIFSWSITALFEILYFRSLYQREVVMPSPVLVPEE